MRILPYVGMVSESNDEHWAKQLSDTLASDVGRIRPVSAVAT